MALFKASAEFVKNGLDQIYSQAEKLTVKVRPLGEQGQYCIHVTDTDPAGDDASLSLREMEIKTAANKIFDPSGERTLSAENFFYTQRFNPPSEDALKL